MVERTDWISTWEEKEQVFQDWFGHSLDAHALLRDGVIVACNEAAATLLGYAEKEDLIHRQIDPLTPPWPSNDHRLGASEEAMRARLTERGSCRFEARLDRADGTALPVEGVWTLLPGGDLVHVDWRDVKEQVALKRQIVGGLERQLQHLGRELHDGLGQLLTSMHLLSDRLALKLAVDAPELAGTADKIARYAQEALLQLRLIAQNLMPEPLNREGLGAALRNLAATTQELTGVGTVFQGEDAEAATLDEHVALHLYRLAQEAVTNAVRHGEAARISISLSAAEDGIILRIDDDGAGFNPRTRQKGSSLGLDGMAYRAALLGASLDLNSVPGKGTCVTCRLPTSALEGREDHEDMEQLVTKMG